VTAGEIGEEAPTAHLELTDRASVPYDQVLPSTSTADRYGGVYSGEAWLAFPR
jgi:hypothetical protein